MSQRKIARNAKDLTLFVIALAVAMTCVEMATALPPVIIVEPQSGDIFGMMISGTVECIAADNVTAVVFVLHGASGDYSLTGALGGNTTDYDRADGFKQTIDAWGGFADGVYNLTATGYAFNGTHLVEQTTDTVLGVIIDLDPPTGSIEIYGPNGTTTTGTRNVLLNLTYSDNHGVYACRYANDDMSYLAAAQWESCKTIKAWTLSEGSGNKTVCYEVEDHAHNEEMFVTAMYCDYINHYPGDDYTAPTAPTVYDGASGDDVDWWNSNTTFSAHWSGATEDMSTIYHRYRVMNSTACYAACSYTGTDTTESATATGLSMREGGLYYFDVQAYNSGNISSASALSDGVRIDLTNPGAPTVNSTTHPNPNTAYPYSTATLNWTATDITSGGNASGIAGYSYMLDTYSETTPDTIIEERYWQQMKPMTNDGYGQVLKINGTGIAYAVYAQVAGNFTQNESVRVKVALAEQISAYDDLMSFNVSLVRVGDEDDITSFTQGTLIADPEAVSYDIDYAYDLSTATEYQFNFTINTTTTADIYDVYVVVRANLADDDNRRNLTLAGTDEAADLMTSTRNFICTEDDSCNKNAAAEYAISVEKADSGDEWETSYSGLGDGTYYFHARAQDEAGNWGNVTHRKVIVDAGGVSIAISSPVDGEIFTTTSTTRNISVKVLVDSNATVNVTAAHPDGSTSTTASQSVRSTQVFDDVQLVYGTNEIYATAMSPSGALTTSRSVYVIVTTDVYPQTNKTLRAIYTGGNSYSGAYLTYGTAGGNYVGLASENAGAVGATYAYADTDLNAIKIFMTSPFDTGRRTDVEAKLGENSFLDDLNPLFGNLAAYTTYVLRGEIRIDDVYLGGLFKGDSGQYELTILNQGLTEEGNVNVSVEKN